MTIEQLRRVHSERPFKPYVLQLADGTTVDVTHPECVAFYPKSPRTIAVALPDTTIKVIDLLLIAAIHIQNGKAGRSRKA